MFSLSNHFLLIVISEQQIATHPATCGYDPIPATCGYDPIPAMCGADFLDEIEWHLTDNCDELAHIAV